MSSFVFGLFVALCGSFQFGYGSGVVNVPGELIRKDVNLNKMEWSLIVSIFSIGGLVGAMGAGDLSDAYGRKKSFVVAG